MQRKTQVKQLLDVSKHTRLGDQQIGTPQEAVLQNDQGDGGTNVHHRE